MFPERRLDGTTRRLAAVRRRRAWLAVAALLLLCPSGRGEAAPGPQTALSVAMDLDHDGARDRVMATAFGVSVRLAHAVGREVVLRPSVRGVVGLVAADADADGDGDLFALLDTGALVLWCNDGAGRFTAVNPRPRGSGLGACGSAARPLQGALVLLADFVPRDAGDHVPPAARVPHLDRAGPAVPRSLAAALPAAVASLVCRAPPLSS